jgi:type I restriction enzyme S subunit
MSFNKAEFGQYPQEWSIATLGEYIEVLTDYHANGAYKKLKENVELLDEENYSIMIRTTNFEQNDFSLKSFKYINEHAYNFLSKTKSL